MKKFIVFTIIFYVGLLLLFSSCVSVSQSSVKYEKNNVYVEESSGVDENWLGLNSFLMVHNTYMHFFLNLDLADEMPLIEKYKFFIN